MKCPHCGAACRSMVLETRATADEILRRRACGACGRAFVSKEFTAPDLRIPRKRTPERQAAENAARRADHSATAVGAGLHLQGVWR